MLSDKKLCLSTPSCCLTFLFLLIIGNRHVGGTSTCPYQLLQSAFKVQVDLEDKPDAGGIQQQVECSTDEKSGLAELIEKGIQKASKKVVETSKRFSFNESGASICKVPEEEENRRLSNRLPMSVRNLESHHRFRYHGGMRCRLCKKDDSDNVSVSTYSLVGSAQCSKTWRKSPRTLRVPVPGKAERMRLKFVLHEIGGFQGQHIFVKINEKTVDLGKFYEALNEGKRDKKNNGRYVWTMKPDSTGQRHDITIYLPKEVFLGKEYLDVNLLYGDMDSDSSDVDDQEFSAKFGPEACLFYFWYTKKRRRRRLVSSPVSSPTTYSSTVSSPTMTYSSPTVVNPASSPVVAERFKIEKEIVTLNDNSNVAGADGSSGSGSLVITPSPRLPSTEGNDNNANTRNKHKFTKSNSNNPVFRKIVRDTLTSILNTDLEAITSEPGHCMFGEEIVVVVHLTPKPEWEKNLPTCKQKQNS